VREKVVHLTYGSRKDVDGLPGNVKRCHRKRLFNIPPERRVGILVHNSEINGDRSGAATKVLETASYRPSGTLQRRRFQVIQQAE
jgi:hypothetical protein